MVDEVRESLYKALMEAHKEAVRRGIEANSVVINKNMVEVPSMWIVDANRDSIEMPPMICGLYAYFTKDELPDGYSFAVFKGREYNERLAEFESIGMEPDELRKAADMYRKVKAVFMED